MTTIREFFEVFNPKSKKDLNYFNISIRKKKEFFDVSQTGLFIALNDSRSIRERLYGIKNIPRSRPVMGQFSLIKK